MQPIAGSNGISIRPIGRRSCPVMGCLEVRRGLFCPHHWGILPRHTKRLLKDRQLTYDLVHYAIAIAIHEEQCLGMRAGMSIDGSEFQPTEETGNIGEKIRAAARQLCPLAIA